MKNQELSDNFIYKEHSESFTTWRNDSDVLASFKLLTNKKIAGKKTKYHNDGIQVQGSVFLHVRVEPGQTIRLESEYDNAIRRVSRKTGQVMGGLCPWLVKVGEEDIVVHKSLDYKQDLLQEQAQGFMLEMKKESEMREALKLIDLRRKQMEQDAENRAAASVTSVPKKAGRPIGS